jgi:zinc D-Ala-D-Ala carboxypeptidase|tara:strand:- start:2515 stop:2925 length:411 start_codon:yes stop_codon:yes gene_type:complete
MATRFTEATWPKDRWPNFSFSELACRETGECVVDEVLVDCLQRLRDKVGPVTVTSGYRSSAHSVERAKERPGTHAMGLAVDVACAGKEAFAVLQTALDVGFTGIGVSQKGENRFLHLDIVTHLDDFPATRPSVWSY